MLRIPNTIWRQAVTLSFTSLLLLSFPQTSKAENSTVTEIGDVLQIALPLAGLAGASIKKDWEGVRQLGYSYGTSLTTTFALKYAVSKWRPDFSNQMSFPSGHTMSAFAGASFIYNRYGKLAGIPAYGLAVFTGYSRVQADAHYLNDVVAGASIAMLSSWYFVSPYEKISLQPVAVNGGAGLQVNVKLGDEIPSRKKSFSDSDWDFDFGLGPAWMEHNKIGFGDQSFDLNSFSKVTDPVTTSDARFGYNLTERQEIGVAIIPFESRDIGFLPSDMTIHGVDFSASEEVETAYQLDRYQLDYTYSFSTGKRWQASLTGILSLEDLSFRMTTVSGGPEIRESVTSVVPLLYGHVGLELLENLWVDAEVGGTSLSDQQLFQPTARLSYALNTSWKAAVQVSYFDYELDQDDFHNAVQYTSLQVYMKHNF